METPKNLVKLENIRKTFNRNTVLEGVSLELNQSEVISIIGGNGAGKSTLMKILTGIYKADDGIIEINGEQMGHLNPNSAHEKGIYLVPQEPLLFPNMTVEKNLTIGFEKNKHEVREESNRLMKELGWHIDLNRMGATLTIAEQQQLEIMKGLLRKSKVLILDEPTSTLTFSETKSLFKVIEQLKNSGVGIFYITHRLDEVYQISTHAIILRDGKVTLKGKIDEFTKDMFIQGLLPVGNEAIQQGIFERNKMNHNGEKPILTVENIVGDGFKNISFEVFKGEVVGIAGLVGAGRTEIAEAIYGVTPIESGKVYLDGKDITNLSIKESVTEGLAYIPEDRFLHGIFSISSVRNNITAQKVKTMGWFTKRKEEEKIAQKYIDRLRIKISSQDEEIKSLSGGNQQKAVIARALSMNPKLIIMDEPTRGIDAAARADIYSIITELKKQGVSILLISSDLEELGRISDRIYAVYQGTCNVCLSLHEITATNLMKAAFGTYEGSDQAYV